MAKVCRKKKFDFSKWKTVLGADGYLKPPPRTRSERTETISFKRGDTVYRKGASYGRIEQGGKYKVESVDNYGFIRLENHRGFYVPRHFKLLLRGQ